MDRGESSAAFSQIRAVFFDAGNTLFRDRRPRAELYADVARRHGRVVDVERLSLVMREAVDRLPSRVDGGFRFSRPWFGRYIRHVFAEVGHDSVPEALSRDLFSAFDRPDTFELFDDVSKTLSGLAGRGLVLGVISNWAPHLPRILEGLGVAHFFRFVLVSAVEEVEKPDGELFQRALALAEVTGNQALHVGDVVEADVRGAERAGMIAVLLDRPGLRSHRSERTVRELSELLALIP